MQGIAGLVDRQRHHVELDVGSAADRVFRAGRAADLPCARRQRPCSGKHPLQPHLGKLDGIADLVVERDALLQPDDQPGLVVILQIATDLGRIGDHGNAESAQQIGRTDAGQLQDLRRLQRAGREDHFAIGAGARKPCHS